MSNNEAINEANLLDRARNSRLAWLATSAGALLSSYAIARNTVFNVDSAAGEPTPALYSDPSDLDQTCFSENLVLPTHPSASMSHAGVKADISNPDQPYDSWQSAIASVHYPAISPECADAGWRRFGRAWMQITYNGHWRNMGGRWKPTYTRIIEGNGGTSWGPSGHEGDWYYWDPGDRVRAKFDTIVKSPTGQTKTTPTKTVRVKVQR